MSEDLLISVIVPVYNAGYYLERCVNSILTQTYNVLELILIDDGSTDESGFLCDSFTRKDSRVIVRHYMNQGVSAARNEGLKLASGDYISFVDSDDYLEPDTYKVLLEQANKANADVVACDYCMVIDEQEHKCSTFSEGKDKNETISNMISFGPRGGNIFSFILVRAALLKKNGLLFPTHLSWAEDFWFTLHSYVLSDRVAKVPMSLYCYNFDNENSATRNETDKALEDKKQCLEECWAFLKEKGLLGRFKKVLSWRILLEKTPWVLSPSLFEHYYRFLPEANEFVEDNPWLSSKMKLLMRLLNNRHIWLASLLTKAYAIKNRICG